MRRIEMLNQDKRQTIRSREVAEEILAGVEAARRRADPDDQKVAGSAFGLLLRGDRFLAQ
jgi:hypothetical protein